LLSLPLYQSDSDFATVMLRSACTTLRIHAGDIGHKAVRQAPEDHTGSRVVAMNGVLPHATYVLGGHPLGISGHECGSRHCTGASLIIQRMRTHQAPND